MKRTNRASRVLSAAIIAAMLHAQGASADIITADQPVIVPSWTADLSLVQNKAPASSIRFIAAPQPDIFAAVTSTSSQNKVNSKAQWKLKGGTTTLAFDTPLSSFWFSYKRKKKAAVQIAFIGAGITLNTLTLEGKKTSTGNAGYTAPDGAWFDSVRITWLRSSGDALRFEPGITVGKFVPAVPAPGTACLALTAGLAARRKRPAHRGICAQISCDTKVIS